MRNCLSILMIFLGLNVVGYAQFSQGPLSPSNAYVSNVGGSLASWQNIDSIYTSDNERASLTANLSTNGSYSDFLVVSDFNFSVPLGVKIDGIMVDVERSDGNGLSKDNIVRMVGASGNILTTDRAKTAAWTATDTYTSYGSSSDKWGRTWVPYEINDPDFGFAISVQRSGGGAQVTLSKIDHIRMTVWYSAFVLPIELLYFNAELDDLGVQVNWATATESNNSHFIIERAGEDGLFTALGIVQAGDADKNIETTYAFVDDYPLQGIAYYRLKQVDINGEYEIFESVFVDRRKESSSSTIALNVNGSIIPFNDVSFKPTGLNIYSMDGSLVLTKKIRQYHSSMMNIPSGIYLIRLNNGTESSSQKVVIP
ncbi:MAG: T9SS type A sorting domain-containing protein [Cryomorphaceae bacterium]